MKEYIGPPRRPGRRIEEAFLVLEKVFFRAVCRSRDDESEPRVRAQLDHLIEALGARDLETIERLIDQIGERAEPLRAYLLSLRPRFEGAEESPVYEPPTESQSQGKPLLGFVRGGLSARLSMTLRAGDLPEIEPSNDEGFVNELGDNDDWESGPEDNPPDLG